MARISKEVYQKLSDENTFPNEEGIDAIEDHTWMNIYVL